MKKLAVALALTVSLSSVNVFAMENTKDIADYGYIFTLKADSVSLFDAAEFNDVDVIADNIYHADTLSDIEDISQVANIDTIAKDMPVELFDIPNDYYFDKQWNINATNADVYWNHDVTGNGVKVGIIDTGICREHPDFDGISISKGMNICAVMDKNTDRYYDTDDKNGHGTGVASIIAAKRNNGIGIAGVTDSCIIDPISVYDADSKYNLSVGSLLTAMEFAYKDECDVINLSLGFKNPSKELIKITDELVEKITDKGTIIIAAAGNDGKTTNSVEYPAACEKVIGVGSVMNGTDGYVRADSSTANESVMISAPGEMVPTASLSGKLYAYRSGTSFAAPLVAAAAAGAKEVYPELNSEMFIDILQNTAIDLEDAGYDIKTGYGMIDFREIYREIYSMIHLNANSEHPIEITDVSIKEQDNTQLANIIIINHWKYDYHCDFTVASYDENNQLLGLERRNRELKNMGDVVLLPFGISENTAKIKVFAWKHGSMEPLAEAVTKVLSP